MGERGARTQGALIARRYGRDVREAAKSGYPEYRAHLDFMDLAAEQYSFNDHAYRRFAETIKDAVDPNGILSPGKQGIWPKALRGARAGRSQGQPLGLPLQLALADGR